MKRNTTPSILAAIRANPGAMVRAIATSADAKLRSVSTLLRRLVEAGQVFGSGPARYRHYFTDAAARDEWAARPENTPEGRLAARAEMHRVYSRGYYERSGKYRQRPPRPRKPKAAKPPKPAKVAQPKAPKLLPMKTPTAFNPDETDKRAKGRGPAHLDGPLVFTDKTRHTVYPRRPDPMFSNTHASY